MPEATGIHVTVSWAVHMPIWVPSGEQTDWPAVAQEPVDDVEGVVELVMAEGAELGAGAATAGEAAAAAEGAEAMDEPASEGAAGDATTDEAAGAGAPEAAIDGAADAAL